MPIFQDPDRQRFYDLWSDDRQGGRKQEPQTSLSHQAPYRGEDAERALSGITRPSIDRGNSSGHNRSALRASDREGLIHYIKHADTTAWKSNSSFGGVSAGHYNPHASNESPAIPGNVVESEAMANVSQSNDLASPAEIERPRSALHSGDFREGTSQSRTQQPTPPSPLPSNHPSSNFLQLSSSPTTPWFATSIFASPFSSQSTSNHVLEERSAPATRSRAPSLGSFSSSYVLKTPTSPLVHQANNTDLDFSPRIDSMGQLERSERVNRRRTLPPETFMQLQSSPTSHRGPFNFQSSDALGSWNDLPYPSHHHPRRSLTSAYSLQLASSVQAPFPRIRRPSISSDLSSKPHAPMVGSYEESILRGRMSMNPSKPLDFTAQIGVLGKGKCKSNLRCPPHVTVPFPAVFYSYPTSGNGRSISDDSPSPYVGSIDLDNSLPRDNSSTSRRRRHHASPAGAREDHNTDRNFSKFADQDSLRKREKRHRRAESPRTPPGGCYRIPQQGQLQIIIKNPNKTAVKLFLVPYDLSDMEPGSKTFIRQRSYSAGPIIDMPLNARKNYGTDRPEASLNTSEDPNDKPVLRYLIHLNICSPSRGRFYLHSSIRVVFANRVPDGKERLRNEIQHPDPRYSPYKPCKDAGHAHASTKSMAERGFQRPALGSDSVAALHPSHPAFAVKRQRLAAKLQPSENRLSCGSPLNQPTAQAQHPFQPIPSLREEVSPLQSPSIEAPHHEGLRVYNKLNKGDLGYGGYPFSSSGPSGPEHGESLLAKRLRGLDVQKHDSQGPYIN